GQPLKVRAVRVPHRLFALSAGILHRVHIHRSVDEGLHGVPALPTPVDDLAGLGGIVGRRMYVEIVMVKTMRKRRVVSADLARRTMELLEGDSAERGRH